MELDQSVDPLVSRLRLFLSVDVVGSTAFKQANQRAFNYDIKVAQETNAEPWFSPIAQFYREIERLFAKEWEYYCSVLAAEHQWPKGPAPELWKSAGDELLYTKVLTDHREALACLHCWKEAIKKYRVILREKYPSLDLKSCAWLAGFPITNTEVVFRSSVGGMPTEYDDDDAVYSNLSLLHQFYADPTGKNLTRDFIGPSIDTGFRLCGLATPRKLILSVDLALVLVHAIRGMPPGFPLGLQIRYDNRAPLKGVLNGTDYPVFWIDVAPSPKIEAVEDRLLGLPANSTDDIKEFCEAFINENPSRIIIPYIKGNPDTYFSRSPEHHEFRLKTLRDYWQNETARRLDEKQAFTQTVDGKGIDEEAVEKLVSSIEAAQTAEPDS